jgi:hypothetical protein
MAQEEKKGFVFYYDYQQHLALLTDAERGKLLMALLEYGKNGTQPQLEGAALMAFSFIKAQKDRDAAKYAETVKKRSEAGKKGGRPQKKDKESEAEESNRKQTKANAFNEKQNKAKKADTVTDTDTDTDTVTVTDIKNNKPPKGGTSFDDVPPPPSDQTPYKAIVAMYHEICTSYSKLRNVSDNRKKAIAARWKEYGHDLDTFRELFELAEASPFLKGKNQKNWTADFNWLMNSENMAKVLEGKYNDKQKGGQNHGEHSGNNERTEHRESSGSGTLSGFQMAGE